MRFSSRADRSSELSIRILGATSSSSTTPGTPATPSVTGIQWDRLPPLDLAANTMPLLGAYDSRSVSVLEQHARWIAESGVGAINLSWWGRGDFEDRAVHLVMDVMHAHDIRVTFHLEPYGPQRAEEFPSDVLYLLKEYGEKRRWDCLLFHRWSDGSEGPIFSCLILSCRGASSTATVSR